MKQPDDFATRVPRARCGGFSFAAPECHFFGICIAPDWFMTFVGMDRVNINKIYRELQDGTRNTYRPDQLIIVEASLTQVAPDESAAPVQTTTETPE